MTKPKIDTSKIRPGDTVTVRGVVSGFHEDDDLRVAIPVRDGNGAVYPGTAYVHPSAIVSHEPAALKVGDRVRLGQSNNFGVILAQHADVSWVLGDHFGCSTQLNEFLSRADTEGK